jgi:hypothetical protein
MRDDNYTHLCAFLLSSVEIDILSSSIGENNLEEMLLRHDEELVTLRLLEVHVTV